MVPPRVVLVDDSPEILSLLSEILRVDGPYEVHQFSGRETTVDDIERVAPDLIVLDLAFDGDGDAGWRLLGQLRGAGTTVSYVPVVVCTGAVDQIRQHKDDLRALARVRLLEKPFAIEEFEDLVHEAIGDRAHEFRR